MSERLPLPDAWRGLCCWVMIVYHLLFDCVMFGRVPYALFTTAPAVVIERFTAWSFILLAGMGSELTRSNLRRGLITLAAGGAVTAVSYAVGAPIRFGVLQFLGLAMILYGGLKKPLERLPEGLTAAVCVLLWQVGWLLANRVTVSVPWLFWLGLRRADFVSFDYFPLLQYFPLFVIGGCAGRNIRRTGGPDILRKPCPKVLTWTGRHSLIVYLAHQPVLYGLCWAIFQITG